MALQHVPFETPAHILTWAAKHWHSMQTVHLYEKHICPSVDDFDCLVIMGGPMGANDDDQFSWMESEKNLIGDAIESGKKILGICLGAQLLAHVLGARVYPNTVKEIGWLNVELTPAAEETSLLRDLPHVFQPLHWHGDTFDLPSGCMHLAQSQHCRNQAFQYGENILGLQFHIEIGQSQAQALVQACGHELVESETIQSAEVLLGNAGAFQACETYLTKVLDRLSDI